MMEVALKENAFATLLVALLARSDALIRLHSLPNCKEHEHTSVDIQEMNRMRRLQIRYFHSAVSAKYPLKFSEIEDRLLLALQL